jgi:CRISPR system Cascade subunit CasC
MSESSESQSQAVDGKTNIKIEVHLLQNFVPSCLNRDDTNTPKSCEFGGVRRARISSQCFKSAMREYFGMEDQSWTGMRTKKLRLQLEDEVKKKASDRVELRFDDESLTKALDLFLWSFYSAMSADEGKQDLTKVLLFVSQYEVETAATAFLSVQDNLMKCLTAKAPRPSRKRTGGEGEDSEGEDTDAGEKKSPFIKSKDKEDIEAIKRIKKELASARQSADIALFGRMLAENSDRNVEAACQVAQSISTHEVDAEFDFYSARDDKNPKGETGAGMLGVTGYQSACYYRYALLDYDQIVENMKGALSGDDVIKGFLKAAVNALPKARQNSMGAQNLPDFGFFVVRNGGSPLSLANAFVRPVRLPRRNDDVETDLFTESVSRLARYHERAAEVFGEDGVISHSLFHLTLDETPDYLRKFGPTSRDKAIAAAVEAVKTAVAKKANSQPTVGAPVVES